MNIGALEFEFLANIAKLRQDMEEAKKAVGGASEFIKGVVSGAGKALAGLAAGLTVGAFAGWIKGAIDAADETSKLAQKMGVATKDVGGLQLAFELGGSSSQGMATAFSKLSKNAAENSDAFKALGIQTRNTDGTLRNAKDLFYDVADAFEGMEDGIVKSARAQELFGKSGAELLPLLNGGSKGLREMAEMAEKLGLVIDDETGKAAEQFNDTLELVHKSSSGVATQLAAKLLPSLNSVVGGFLDLITKGDYVTKTADAISAAMKGLYTAGVIVAEVFTSVGKTAAAAVAQVVMVMQGDFKGAMEVGKQWTQDIKKDWTGTVQNLAKVWDDTAGETTAALGAVTKATKGATFETKEQKKAVDEAAKAYESFNKKLLESADELRHNLAEGEKMSANQKLLAQLTAKNTDEVLKLTEKRRLELIEQAKQNIALEKQTKQRDLERKAMEETGKENDKFREGLQKQTDDIFKQVKQMEESNAVILLNKEQLGKLEVQKLLDAAAQAERNAQDAESKMLGEDLVNEYKKQAEGLRELAKLKGDKVHLEAAKEANEAWSKLTQEIGTGLTDSLFRAFESGKDFMGTFWDGVKNLFKTTVLKLMIQPVQKGMNDFIGSIMGSGSGGSSGGGMSGLGSWIGDGLSAFGNWMGEGSTIGGWANTAGSWLKSGSSGAGGASMFGAFGSAFSGGGALANAGLGGAALQGGWTAAMNGNAAQGLGQIAGAGGAMLGGFMAGRGVGQLVSGGYGLGGGSGNSAVNTGAAVGAAIGSIIPGLGTMIGGLIGGALGGLANRAFGHKAKEYNGDKGLEGTFSNGGMSGNAWADWVKKGGWFRSDKHGTDTFAMEAEVAEGLKQGAKAVYDKTEEWAKALGLPAEKLKAVTTQFRVVLTDSDEANAKVLTEAYTKYASDLANSFASDLKPFMRAGEQLADTMQRLLIIKQFSEGINEFGGIFSRMANLSIDAKEQLIGLAGGLEAFIGKAQSFVNDYYSQGEKVGLQAKQVMSVFESIGIDASGLGSREDFRALVESQNINTEEGRRVFSALLDIGPSFAAVADYLKENSLTLAEAAATAPQVEALQALLTKQDQATEQQAKMVDGQQETNGLLGDIFVAISTGNANITTSMANLADSMMRWGNGFVDIQSRPITEAEPA